MFTYSSHSILAKIDVVRGVAKAVMVDLNVGPETPGMADSVSEALLLVTEPWLDSGTSNLS